MKISSILFTGGFDLASANLGYEMSKEFANMGIFSKLLIRESHLKLWKSLHPNENPNEDPLLIIIKEQNSAIRNIKEFFVAKKFDLVFSIGLGGLWYLPYINRPYVTYATGADLTELAGGRGYSGFQVKQAKKVFKNSKLVFHSIERSHIEMIKSLKLKKTIPWRQFIDIKFWKNDEENENKNSQLRIFHPTALHWINKYSNQRIKSNDIVFKGFRIFLDKGGKGELFFRKRGEDVKETLELIKKLNLEKNVKSLPNSQDRTDQRRVMKTMDIVIDQFGVGNFGLITLESMAMKKPVITEYSEIISKQVYSLKDEKPPILHASNPEEIAEQLLFVQNKSNLEEISRKSREWIERVHEPKKLAKWYFQKILDEI